MSVAEVYFAIQSTDVWNKRMVIQVGYKFRLVIAISYYELSAILRRHYCIILEIVEHVLPVSVLQLFHTKLRTSQIEKTLLWLPRK